jgi:DNA-binding NtrC family response regulator
MLTMNNITIVSFGDKSSKDYAVGKNSTGNNPDKSPDEKNPAEQNSTEADLAEAVRLTLSSHDYPAICITGKENLPTGNSAQHPLVYIFILDTLVSEDHLHTLNLIKSITSGEHAIHIGLISKPQNLPQEDLFSLFHEILFWPCSAKEIKARIDRFTHLSQKINLGDQKLLQEFSALNLIGGSPGFVNTINLIKKIAHCHAPVLIQGETGTGKENAARSIHYLSNRREHGFIPVNCAAIPDELFESEIFGHEKGAFTDAKSSQTGLVALANGGTLFLDEVDSLTPKAQAALLRFLQTREYRPLGGRETRLADVRILAATNADLPILVSQKYFREDLFYRLNVLNIFMPPLRERAADIPLIAKALLYKFSQEYNTQPKQLSAHLLNQLMQQAWPGNVRELENTLLRAFLLSSDSMLTSLTGHGTANSNDGVPSGVHSDSTSHATPSHLTFQDAKAEVINQFEKQYLKEVLLLTEGNVSAAARIAGKERRALGKLIRKYRIDKSLYQSIPAL